MLICTGKNKCPIVPDVIFMKKSLKLTCKQLPVLTLGQAITSEETKDCSRDACRATGANEHQKQTQLSRPKGNSRSSNHSSAGFSSFELSCSVQGSS